MSWDCSGRLLASCSRDKSVWIWEMDEAHEFEVVAVKRSHNGDVKCVRWHPNEQFLVSCSYDNNVKSYKCDDTEDDWFVNQLLKSHASTVWSAAFEPMRGDAFATVSDDKSLVIWQTMGVQTETDSDIDGSKGKLLNLDELAFRLQQRIENLHTEAIYSVDWLCHRADGVSLIVTGSADNCIQILSRAGEGADATWSVVHTMDEAHATDVNWVEFGPRLQPGVFLLASASDDGILKIWRVETPIDTERFKNEHDSFEYDAAYKDIVNEID